MMIKLLKTGFLSLLLLAPLQALAHTHLEKSTPANEATLHAAPASIDLEFNGAVRLIKLEITSNGKALETGFKPAAETMAKFSIPTPGLTDGSYTVNWAVIGEDGHTVTNTFNFSVDSSVTASHAH